MDFTEVTDADDDNDDSEQADGYSDW
jgi:hypothetical protein